jgi:saccharopine dehydrogenase-like NADP-dependent oxidoreductase
MSANRTNSKCDAIATPLGRLIPTVQVGADNVSELEGLITQK